MFAWAVVSSNEMEEQPKPEQKPVEPERQIVDATDEFLGQSIILTGMVLPEPKKS